jgi:hypothetical protein
MMEMVALETVAAAGHGIRRESPSGAIMAKRAARRKAARTAATPK